MSGAMERTLPSLAGYGSKDRSRRRTPRRRNGSQHPTRNVYKVGRLHIDFDAYEVFLDGRKIHIFLREFEILRLLVQFPNRVLTRERILESVWGRKGRGIAPRTIDVHVRRLRARIERDQAHPEV